MAATIEVGKEHHNLGPEERGRWIEIVLWIDDTDAALNALFTQGVPVLSPARDFLDGAVRVGLDR